MNDPAAGAAMPGADDQELIDWLLGVDPALTWQVQRDLQRLPEQTWRHTRRLVATQGRGARLLALQDADGQWAGGAYFPAEGHPTAGGDGQPWTATTWTLNTLREAGLDAAVLGDTAARLAANSRWEYDDLPYWGGEVDCCINSYTLANGTWLGADVAGLVDWFAEHQLSDGGWNCEWESGSVRSSFHSTLSTVTGLLYRERHGPADQRLVELRRAGEEYLLSRRLLNRASTAAPVGPWVAQFGYPFRWRYNALAALDHFRAAFTHDRRPWDPRLDEAVALVRARQRTDGRWIQETHLTGREWFPLDVAVGEPSPWLTLIGLRVLAWADTPT